MEVDKRTSGYMDTIEALINRRITDKEAAAMLLKSGYSADTESADRTVVLMHNEISNFRMSKK